MSAKNDALVAGFREVRKVTTCEVCFNESLTAALDLGPYPLCDDLLSPEDLGPRRAYPQEIAVCERCLTAHQVYQVSKELLFPNSYHYRSRLTNDVINGMASLVAGTMRSYPPAEGARVLDIGCNDGTLLTMFKEAGLITVGVDPTDAVLESPSNLDAAHREYFSEDTALHLKDRWGTFDYITMTNVFAHIEDLPRLCVALRCLIGPSTVLVIENHYLGSILSGSQFDTFYHEHPRTYSATSFSYIADQLDLRVTSVTRPSRYGGNIRVMLTKRSDIEPSSEVNDESDFVDELKRLQTTYTDWQSETASRMASIAGRNSLAGKALPGRAVMLINSLGLSSDLMASVYEQPGSPKVGHVVPNTMNRIESDHALLADQPSDLVIWAWHIADEVLPYLQRLGYRGRVWKPMPSMTLLATL